MEEQFRMNSGSRHSGLTRLSGLGATGHKNSYYGTPVYSSNENR